MASIYAVHSQDGTKTFSGKRKAIAYARRKALEDPLDRVYVEGPNYRRSVEAPKRTIEEARRSLMNPRRKISGGALSKILDSGWKSVKMRVHKGETQVAFYGKEAQKILKKLSGAKNPKRRRNVAAGFYDEEGIFHPLRASYDYDAKRAGERSKPKRRKR